MATHLHELWTRILGFLNPKFSGGGVSIKCIIVLHYFF